MYQPILFITVCAQSAIALLLFKLPSRFTPNPRATTLIDIKAEEIKCWHCAYTKVKNWNIDIATYDQSDVISRALRTDGAWENEAIQRACEQYQIHGARGNFLDIGANIGAFGLPLARCLQVYSRDNGYLIAVEGIKNNTQRFRASIKRNKFYNIHLYEYALSSHDAKDTVTMSEHLNNNGHKEGINSSTHGSPMKLESDMPVTTIDAIAKAEGTPMNRIFFMKLDIDWREPQMLEGAEQFMKNNGPCLIFSDIFSTYRNTRKYLETGKNPKPVDKRYALATTGSDIKKKTEALFEKWGYTDYIEENATGTFEGWFRHKNWKSCLLRLQ